MFEPNIPDNDTWILLSISFLHTVEPQWLEHSWDHENVLEIWIVQATEG